MSNSYASGLEGLFKFFFAVVVFIVMGMFAAGVYLGYRLTRDGLPHIHVQIESK